MTGAAGGIVRSYWLGLLALVCVVVGVLAGVDPKLGLEATLALCFVAVVLANLTAGLCVFTFLIFLEVFNFGGPALSLTKVVGLLLFVSWLASTATGRHRGRALFAEQPLFAWSATAFVAWSAVSVVWATDSGAAAGSTERFLLDSLLLPIVYGGIRTRRQLLLVMASFLAGAAFSAAYGFHSTVGGRLAGSIGDPNEEASVLVASIAIAIGLIATQRKGGGRRAWIAVAAAVSLFGLLATLSRGGLVASGCVLLAGIVLGGRWRNRAVLAVLVSLSLAGIYFSVIAPTAARQRVTSTGTSGRTDLWKIGVAMFEAHPVTGVGSGNYIKVAARYVPRVGLVRRADLIVASPHVVHNTYLEALDDLGIPGLLFLLGMVGGSFRAGLAAVRRYQAAHDTGFELLSRMTLLALMAILSADFFIVGQYAKELWLLLALPPVLLALASASDRVQ